MTDTGRTNEVIISKKISDMLRLKTGDSFAMYFVQDPPRSRKFTISGIYETSLEEFDKMYVFCDIGHIKRLNSWEDDQVSGFEVFINDFDRLDEMTMAVRDAVGYKLLENETKFKVTNIRMRYPQIFDWLNFQDMNVIIIITLMLLVAGFNMISGLLILILEKTNMIGIFKALGSENGDDTQSVPLPGCLSYRQRSVLGKCCRDRTCFSAAQNRTYHTRCFFILYQNRSC